MRVLLLVVWFSLTSTIVVAQQKLRKAVSEITHAITVNNKYESQFVGFAGTPSTQYQHYQQLRATATEAELVALLHHKNAVVRIYSFRALYEQNEKLARKLSAPLLSDTATFMTLQGCIAGSETVKTHIGRMLRNTD